MSCNRYCGGPGDCLVLIAAAFALQLAQGRTLEDIQLLSAFFTSLADNLALIAVAAPDCDNSTTTTTSQAVL